MRLRLWSGNVNDPHIIQQEKNNYLVLRIGVWDPIFFLPWDLEEFFWIPDLIE
jgi:hypothetical protein